MLGRVGGMTNVIRGELSEADIRVQDTGHLIPLI